MNSLIIRRKLAEHISRLKFPLRTLCTDAAPKVSSSHSVQSSNDHVGQQSFRNEVHSYDIAIVGGGMVGMAFACSLARMPLTKHLKVAIIDSNPALLKGLCIKKEDPPDPRVSTVTPATISLFKDVGAWKYVVQNRHAYFDQMQVWDYTGLGYTKYNARDVHKDTLGCVVENKVLHSSLLSCIQDTDFQKTIYPSRLSSMTLQPRNLSMGVDSTSSGLNERGNLAKLDLSDGNSLYAKLVVGADGSKSRVRELAGFKTTGWNYSQNAIICTVEHSVENRCAWQRFLPSGPIALLPIGDNFSNIVWTMKPKEATDRKSLAEDDFVKDVNYALDYGFGPHPKSSTLGSGGIFSWFKTDVNLSPDECFKVPPKLHVVLIGDAAHTVHPLAGQGVNLGFGDAFALSRIISEGIAVGTDIAEVLLLKKYEAERKSANVTMMAILDGFQKAYSIDFGPLNILRAAAFNGVGIFHPLKGVLFHMPQGIKDSQFSLEIDVNMVRYFPFINLVKE
ncbi:ubiquinone biosynthesis monooxygenase COQ6 mitochondrial [Prunus yedoensis var. nudiflora]|uniref:Ubiquinone biosynthesis monooxygenase COQ6, mitochondrial n=1 Tax=Prunus yedoensis var. nudiflora TaxID=2094558 RepID=A0A314UPC8_PRUYE|nr:ubiquinone biosynthesis monooxygenase COQ6 mitochondrial [Prunus yedoensis var. nudiflora]